MRLEDFGVVRICGGLAVMTATIILALSFGFDTSVPSGTGDGRVHNQGLMQQQKNWVTVGTGILIVGGILAGLGGTAETRAGSSGTKKCPQCAETIKQEARICRYCQYRFDSGEEVAQITAFEAEQQRVRERTCPACGAIVEDKPVCPVCFHSVGDSVSMTSRLPAARSFRVIVDRVHPLRVAALIALVGRVNPALKLTESDIATQAGGIVLDHGLTLEEANLMMVILDEGGFLPRKEQELETSPAAA